MRQRQSTVRPAHVHSMAHRLLLEHLQLKDYGRCLPARLFASLLLLAACWQMSLSLVCQQVHNAPGRETVRKALLAALPPKPLTLRDRLLAMLRATLPKHLRGRPLPFSIDLNQRPYYGKSKRGVTRRAKKHSTRKSFTYATVAIMEPWGRFTVGLLLTRPHMNLTTVIAELLGQVAEAGLSVAYLMLDKEFNARARRPARATGSSSSRRPPRRAGTTTPGPPRCGSGTRSRRSCGRRAS
jgi:hypothetical protein